MIINRERSLGFVKLSEKPELKLSLVNDNVYLSPLFELCMLATRRIKTRIDITKSRYQYYKNLKETDMSQYDLNFVDLYRNGIIELRYNSHEYKVKNLYIIVGVQKGQNTIHLINCLDDVETDCLTGEVIEGFERKEIMSLCDSESFYDLYVLCKDHFLLVDSKLIITTDILDDVFDIISRFNGKRHKRVPETVYMVED